MAVVEGCEGISIAPTHEHHQVLVREMWVAYLVVPSRHLPSTSRIFERRWFSSRGPSNRGSPQRGGLTDQSGPCSERRSFICLPGCIDKATPFWPLRTKMARNV